MPRGTIWTEEMKEKAREAKESKRASYFSASCEEIAIEEYGMGFRLELERKTYYYGHLSQVVHGRKIREYLLLRGSDAEKAFVADLQKRFPPM